MDTALKVLMWLAILGLAGIGLGIALWIISIAFAAVFVSGSGVVFMVKKIGNDWRTWIAFCGWFILAAIFAVALTAVVMALIELIPGLRQEDLDAIGGVLTGALFVFLASVMNRRELAPTQYMIGGMLLLSTNAVLVFRLGLAEWVRPYFSWAMFIYEALGMIAGCGLAVRWLRAPSKPLAPSSEGS